MLRIFVANADIQRDHVEGRDRQLCIAGVDFQIGCEGGIGLGGFENVVFERTDTCGFLRIAIEAESDECIAQEIVWAECAKCFGIGT